MRKRHNGLSYRAPGHAMTCRCTLCKHYDARHGQPDPAVAKLVAERAEASRAAAEPTPGPAEVAVASVASKAKTAAAATKDGAEA